MCFCGKLLKISAGIACCFNIDNWSDWRHGCQVGLQQGEAVPWTSPFLPVLFFTSFFFCCLSIFFHLRRRIVKSTCVLLFSCFSSCWWVHFPRSVPLRQSNIKMAFAESWGWSTQRRPKANRHHDDHLPASICALRRVDGRPWPGDVAVVGQGLAVDRLLLLHVCQLLSQPARQN